LSPTDGEVERVFLGVVGDANPPPNVEVAHRHQLRRRTAAAGLSTVWVWISARRSARRFCEPAKRWNPVDVDVEVRELLEEQRDLLYVDAELLGATAHAHPRALDLEVGVHAHCHLRPDTEIVPRLYDPEPPPSATPAPPARRPATACRSSAGDFPGPANDICDAGSGVSRATRISPPEATSKESTRDDRCWTRAGIGLALTAYEISRPGGSAALTRSTRPVSIVRS
jgi:hypothetical protein